MAEDETVSYFIVGLIGTFRIMDKRYNGLVGDLKTMAQFVFIYEKQIRFINKNQEFQELFPDAYRNYEQKIKKHLRYDKAGYLKEAILDKKVGKDTTLAFTKNKIMIVDLCRHIRNAICHASLYKKRDKLFIEDMNSSQVASSFGYIEYPAIKEFFVAIIREF